jgi:ABC-type uncharacterized transport system involved in gliding motility auxiliary subunit
LKFVADYGLALQVSMQQGMQPVRHVGILQLGDDQLPDADMIVGQLDSLNVSTAGALSAVDGATTRLQPLLSSSEQAMLMDSDKLSFLSNPADLLNDFQPQGKVFTLAARVTGPAKTAFPQGVPVESAEPDSSESSDANATDPAKVFADAKPADLSAGKDKTVPEAVSSVADVIQTGNINVVIVADTDVLSDRLWVQVRQFFGQQIAQPFADNGAFFFNSVDNLSGSNDLISIRNRGRFLRPFTVVQAMERDAESAFRNKEQDLQRQLEQTEAKLLELQGQRDDAGNAMTLSPEQEAEIVRFQDEKLRIRRELRNVQHQLNKDIDRLDQQLKLFNIVLIPALLIVLGIVVAWLKRRRYRNAMV